MALSAEDRAREPFILVTAEHRGPPSTSYLDSGVQLYAWLLKEWHRLQDELASSSDRQLQRQMEADLSVSGLD